MSKISKGTRLIRRRTGVVREVVGFTTKPTNSSPSDGERRARLIDPLGELPEARTKVSQITKTYQTI